MFHCRRLALLAALFFFPQFAQAQTATWLVTFDNPTAVPSVYQPLLTSHFLAAGAAWNQYLRPVSDVTIDIRIFVNTGIPRFTGRSETSSYVGQFNGMNLYEQGVGAQIRTGIDPNGSICDVHIEVNPTNSYLTNQLWFDPDPYQRTAPVPGNKTDAMSVALHELGHAIGFNGWRSGTDGSLPGNYLSTWDQHVSFDGSNMFFNGPEAMAQHGNQPVAVTFDNPNHIGNNSPRPGSELIPDLMNGVVFTNGQRYFISPLDAAILADTGLPVAIPVPEPSLTIAIAFVGSAVFLARRRRRRQSV